MLKLPSIVQNQISLGELSYGHGKAIASLPEEEIVPMVGRIHDESLSVSETERLVQERLSEGLHHPAPLIPNDVDAIQIKNRKKSITFIFESEEKKQEFIQKLKKKD